VILLISDTPVAGTVNRIAYWIGQLSGCKCHALVKRNYPNNAFKLENGTFGGLPNWEDIVAQCVREAQFIFIHNIADSKLLDLIFTARCADTRVYYQIHSPPLEGPLFDYQVISDYPFNKVLAVAQGYGRFIKDSLLVPNIIADFIPPYAIKKSPLIFIPHMRSTSFRWSAKFTESDKKFLLLNRNKIGNYSISKSIQELYGHEAITHEEMLLYLQAVSIIIDDINTGLFHQTTLEALKSGCAVFSAADLESIEQFCIAANVSPPPFINIFGIEEVVSLLTDCSFRKNLSKIMTKSEEYGRLYLSEERLAQCYWAKIKSLVKEFE
jgi:hypothetical protein